MWREVVGWLWAVAKHWVLVTASAAVSVATLLNDHFAWWPVSNRAFGFLGLAFLLIACFLAWREEHRAVLENAASRDVIGERLAQLRAYGVTKLYAIPPLSEEELSKWKERRERWVKDVCENLEERYGQPARLKFEILGPLPLTMFTHSFNDDHAHELRILERRLEILGEIIDTK